MITESMMRSSLVVGLCGRKRVGKDTVAAYLTKKYGFVQTSLAAPIKQGLEAMLQDYRVGSAHFEQDDLKEAHIAGLGGGTITPRTLMTTLGTEWGKDLISGDIWIKALLFRIDRLVATGQKCVVVSDVRFRDEAFTLLKYGATLWHIARPGYGLDNQHRSEQENLEDLCTECFENDGTPQDLLWQVDNTLTHIYAHNEMPNRSTPIG